MLNKLTTPLINTRKDENPYLLLVAHFDNRKHHHGDDWKFIESSNNLIIDGNITAVETFREKYSKTYNKSFNRRVMHNGADKYVVEFTDSKTAKLYS